MAGLGVTQRGKEGLLNRESSAKGASTNSSVILRSITLAGLWLGVLVDASNSITGEVEAGRSGVPG